MQDARVSLIVRYGCAVVSTALALGLRLLLDPVLGDQFPFALFFLAAVFTAWVGGFGPALVAVALGAVLSAYYLLAPRGSPFFAGWGQLIGLGLYMLVGLGMAALGGAMRAGQRRAEQRAEAVAREREKLRVTVQSKAAILETSLDCIITCDQNGSVLEFNPAAERTFGYERGEVIGRDLAERIIPPSLREQHRRGMAHYLATGKSSLLGRRIEMRALRKDGTEFPVEVAITSITSQGLPQFTAHLRDISERKRIEARRNVRLAVTQVLAQAGTIKEAAPRILQAICDVFGWDTAGFWSVDAAANVLRCLGVWSGARASVEAFRAASQQCNFAPGVGLPGRVWSSGRPAWIPDVTKDDNFPRAAVAAQVGLHGAIACPVVVGNDTLGVIEFFSRHVQEPDADLLEMLNTVAGQIGQFIERREAEERLRRSERELTDFFENATGGGGGNIGVGIEFTGSQVSSVNGAITITGTALDGASPAINIEGASISISGAPVLTLIADSMNVNAAAISADQVFLLQETNEAAINLGGADAAGTLGLTDDELDDIVADTIAIGDANTGLMQFQNSIIRASATDFVLTADNLGSTSNDGSAELTLRGGTLSFGAGTTLGAAVDGTVVDSGYDQLKVDGNVNLDNLNVALEGSYTPTFGDFFDLVTLSGNATGAFAAATTMLNGVTLDLTTTANTGRASVAAPVLAANYTWDDAANTLEIHLGTGQSVTVSESFGAVSFQLASGVFAQDGGDTADGDGTDTITIAATNLASTIAIDNMLAGVGVNDVTFGAGGVQTGQFIVNLLSGALGALGTIAFTGGFDVSVTDAIALTTPRNIAIGGGTELSTSGSGGIKLLANRAELPTSGAFVGIDVDGATITTTGAGNIGLSGSGGDSGADNIGILLHNGGKLQSTATNADAGTITLDGAGSGGARAKGVRLDGAGTEITSVAGDIQITGRGAASSTGVNHGVELQSAALIASTGTGSNAANITIDGTGGAGSGSNIGVVVESSVSNSRITSVDGDIQITGAGVGGPGLRVGFHGEIASTGAAAITLISDAIDVSIQGAIAAGTNTVTLKQKTPGTFINIGSEVDTTANTLELSNAELDSIVAGSIHIGDETSDTITVSGAIQHAGDADFVVTTGRDIAFGTIDSWTTADGDLTFSANQQATPTSGNFVGIVLFRGTITTTGAGDISLIGRGGDTDTDLENNGIQLFNASVQSTALGATAGTITLNGTGGSGTDHNAGVFLNGSLTQITSVDGAIEITGQGGAGSGANNHGVDLTGGAVVSSTGIGASAATINIDGTGGAGTHGNDGVRVQDAGTQVTAVDGDIIINGQGGAASGNANIGVTVTTGAVVSSTGADAGTRIVFDGAGGTGVNGNSGVRISDADAQVSSVAASIEIFGTAGPGSSTAIELLVADAVTVTAVNGLVLAGDSMNIAVANAIAAGANKVTLLQETQGTGIDIGGADATDVLGLTNDELNHITAGAIDIGNKYTGVITVSAPITFNNPTGDGPNLKLHSADTVAINADIDTDNGDLTVRGATVLQDGRTLTVGSGTATFNSGILNVGASPGAATVVGTLELASSYLAEINGAIPGTEYDQLIATEGVILDDVYLDLSVAVDPAVGQSFTLIDNQSGNAVDGTFNDLPEGALINIQGTIFQITYLGGTGNDVVLTRIATPPANLVVDNTGDVYDGNFDEGELTLREAIELANLLDDANTITFDLPAGSAITLGSAELAALEHDVTISGPGANLLTFDAAGQGRHFTVNSGATAALSGLTLINGTGIQVGGSIVNSGALTLTACVFRDNSSSLGGAVYNEGSLTVTDCTFSHNAADEGGAIYNARDAYVTKSTFSHNTAAVAGGGLYTNFFADVSLCTFSGNSSSAGGGIYQDGETLMAACTITNNTANEGGGIDSNGVLILTNSIVAGNKTPDDVASDLSGGVGGDGHNLIGDAATAGGLTPTNGNLIGVDPLLAPLGSYGRGCQRQRRT